MKVIIQRVSKAQVSGDYFDTNHALPDSITKS